MQKYLTVGTSSINRELFRNVIPYPSNYSTKPYGGLWLSPFDKIDSNLWLRYISSSDSLFYYKFSENGCIVDLKEGTKVLNITSKDEFEQAHIKYPSIFEPLFFSCFLGEDPKLLDYEQIAQDYDGIFFKSDVLDQNHADWGIPSLVLFNLNCIQNYTPIKIGYEYGYLAHDKDFFIEEEQAPRIIEPISQTFLDLYDLIENSYLQYIEENPNIISYESFKDYYSTLFLSIRLFVEKECEKYQLILEKIVAQTANLKSGDKNYHHFVYAIVYKLLNNQMKKTIDRRKELVAKRTRSKQKEYYI